MKKIITLAGFSVLLTLSAFSEESGETWSRTYRRVTDLEQKFAIMQNIAPLDDKSLEPFLTSSLEDLVYGDLSQYRRTPTTYDDWEALTRLIVKELGDVKAQGASTAIWDVVRTAEVPLLKAEALIALGQIRAVEYVSEIATILRNLNFNTRQENQAAEIEAYGAVTALDKMKDPAGLEPLFYAAIGWYSDRVTSYAEEAVLGLSDDPASMLIPVLTDAADYAEKRQAFALAMNSDSPPESKTNAAVVALKEGLKYAETDPTRIRQLANLRSDAITVLISMNASHSESPALLDQAIDEGEIDEGLIAIQALGIDGSRAAAEILARRLSEFNERQEAGLAINQDELLFVRQLIFALGEAGDEVGLQPLTEMAYVGYTPALVRQAEEAMKKISP
ncbi:MAG: hypothetical protein P1P77_05455 [Spirochaetaceae bacterium]|nr:hypothetical protein [Spirochaetaceae bacterium]